MKALFDPLGPRWQRMVRPIRKVLLAWWWAPLLIAVIVLVASSLVSQLVTIGCIPITLLLAFQSGYLYHERLARLGTQSRLFFNGIAEPE